MGSLADLLIASPSDAPAIVASEYPLGTFEGVNIDGLDPLKLAALHSLLVVKDINDLLAQYQPVGEASANGPWLIKFPDELTAFLAEIAPQDLTSTAARWAATDQLQGEGWSVQDAEQFLGRLMHFSQTATFDELDVFLWIYN